MGRLDGWGLNHRESLNMVKRKKSNLLNVAQEVLGGDSDGPVDLARWADGMLAIAGYMWHLRKVDPAPIRAARTIDLQLPDPARDILVERTELADDLKDRLRGSGAVRVSLDELASIFRCLPPLMESSSQDQDVLRLCITCISTFTDAVTAASKGPEEQKPKKRSRESKGE